MDATTGYIIVIITLTVIILLLIIIWTISVFTAPAVSAPISEEAPYGVYPGTDANTLNTCGSSGTEPCIFPATSLGQSVTTCISFGDKCEAFVYTASLQMVKLVTLTATAFTNPLSDLYVKNVVDTT
jgi:hypothetical protein